VRDPRAVGVLRRHEPDGRVPRVLIVVRHPREVRRILMRLECGPDSQGAR
jgi:hypothetical protein